MYSNNPRHFCDAVSDLLAVVAGGLYVRCFNAISGSLNWESSVPVIDASRGAVLKLIGSGKWSQII